MDVNNAVMTVKEVSEYLKVAESTIYKLAQGGKLPARKVGGMWRFSRTGLDQWLAGLSLPGEDETVGVTGEQRKTASGKILLRGEDNAA